MCEAKDRQRIGVLGENFLKKAIYRVIDELGYKRRIYSNCIIGYQSVYGNITTEIDTVVFSPDRIYLFEVKKARYVANDYNAKTWELFDEEKNSNVACSNPLVQNQYHKKILCETLGIASSCITTIEVLLSNGKDYSRGSPYPNDYVFDEHDLLTELRYVMVSLNRSAIDIEQAHESFIKKLNESNGTPQQHRRNRVRVDRIVKQLRAEHKRVFRFTDKIKCSFCKCGYLTFEKCSFEIMQKDIPHKRLYLICDKCGRRLDYSRAFDIDTIQELEVIGMKEQNTSTEEETHMNTVLDERYLWKAKYENMEHALMVSNREIVALLLKFKENNVAIKAKDERIAELEIALEKSKQPTECIKHLLLFLFLECRKILAFVGRLTVMVFNKVKKMIMESNQ